MIENIFGITYSAIEYRVSIKQFQFMIKYILKEIFKLKEDCINVKINSINDETIFEICDENKDEIARILTGEDFNSKTEVKIKGIILNKLFNNSYYVLEEIIYEPGFHYKAKEIKFIVKNHHFEQNNNNSIINDDVLNKTMMQLNILNEKKESIIKKHKKTL